MRVVGAARPTAKCGTIVTLWCAPHRVSPVHSSRSGRFLSFGTTIAKRHMGIISIQKYTRAQHTQRTQHKHKNQTVTRVKAKLSEFLCVCVCVFI